MLVVITSTYKNVWGLLNFSNLHVYIYMYMYYINYTMYSVFPYNNMFTKYYYSFLSLSLSLSLTLSRNGGWKRERD